MVREINSMETLKTIVDGNTFVVVDFFTPGCPPCKKLAPFIEEINKQYTQITFLKVNCQAQNNIAQEFDVGAVPVLIYIKNGKVVGKTLGTDEQEILTTLNSM